MKIKYKSFFRKVKQSSEYWEELFNLELIDDISKIMKSNKISQTKLACLLGTSEAYVSKILNGNLNLSIKSISRLAFALKSAPHIHIAPLDVIVEWKERRSSDIRTEASVQRMGDRYTAYLVDYKAVQTVDFVVTSGIPESYSVTSDDWIIAHKSPE